MKFARCECILETASRADVDLPFKSATHSGVYLRVCHHEGFGKPHDKCVLPTEDSPQHLQCIRVYHTCLMCHVQQNF